MYWIFAVPAVYPQPQVSPSRTLLPRPANWRRPASAAITPTVAKVAAPTFDIQSGRSPALPETPGKEATTEAAAEA